MKIVLEGPDGAGKTTLAEKISNRLGWPTHHLTGSSDPEFMKRQFLDASIKHDVILDRYVVSNLAYSHVFGGLRISDSVLAPILSAQLEGPYKDLYVFCLPGLRTDGTVTYRKMFEDLVNSRDEMYTSVDGMCKLWQYMSVVADVFSVSGMVFTYDYTYDDTDSLLDRIVDKVRAVNS